MFFPQKPVQRYGERVLRRVDIWSVPRPNAPSLKTALEKPIAQFICGVELVDDGRISMDANQWSYLPQDPDYDGQQTISDHLYASDMAAVKAMPSTRLPGTTTRPCKGL